MACSPGVNCIGFLAASFSFNRDHYQPRERPSPLARVQWKVHERENAYTRRDVFFDLTRGHSPTSSASPISVRRVSARFHCVRSPVEDIDSRLPAARSARRLTKRACRAPFLFLLLSSRLYRYKLIASASPKGSTRRDAVSRGIWVRGAMGREGTEINVPFSPVRDDASDNARILICGRGDYSSFPVRDPASTLEYGVKVYGATGANSR